MTSFLKTAFLVLFYFGITLPSLSAPLSLKIGVTAGPHVDIMNFVKEKAAEEGLDLTIIEFNDFILPNIALAEGSLDANIYQHAAFLESQKTSRDYKFVSLGKTILLPMGVYSSKHTSLENIPRTGKVAIPNDPTNAGRALLVLDSLGLLKLREGVGSEASVIDIRQNPKHLKIVEVEAPQLPRSLDDVDIAVMNTDWALVAGLDLQSALAQESSDSPYANLIVVRDEDKEKESLQKLKEIYQSDATKNFIQETFKGAVLTSW